MRDAPARIGPYEVEGHLGAGGMGETYTAVRRGPGDFEQRVCLKRIRRDVADDPELVRQFMAEASIVARLRHAGIAQVLDFGEDAGEYYLALELIEGLDLRELLLRAGKLDGDTVLMLAIDLAIALDVAHRADGGAVIHRDVSTSNVLVSREGEVKLTDFGIARSLEGPVHTQSGTVKGKVPYLAPEYARSGEFDARCDLFSLGVTLYECAAGERPYDGSTDLDTLERAARGDREPTAERCPQLPAALSECIEQLIDPDPAARPQSAAALLDLLDALPRPSQRTRRMLAEQLRSLTNHDRMARDRHPTPAELAPTVAENAQGRAPTRTRMRPDAQRLRPRPSRGPLVALSIAVAVASVAAILYLQREPPAPQSAERTAPSRAPAAAPTSTGLSAAPPRTTPSQPQEPAPIVVLPEGRSAPVLPGDGATQKPAPARLEVVVVPFGQVSIDGKARGSSPVKLALPAGTHRISARNADRTFERKITLEAGEQRRVMLR